MANEGNVIDREDLFRNRIILEDGLLNTRTTIFLATSTLLMTAFGVAKESPFQLYIPALGAAVTSIWGLCTYQSWMALSALTRTYFQYLEDENKKLVEQTVQKALYSQRWLRPTNLLALGLPLVFLSVWPIAFLISVGVVELKIQIAWFLGQIFAEIMAAYSYLRLCQYKVKQWLTHKHKASKGYASDSNIAKETLLFGFRLSEERVSRTCVALLERRSVSQFECDPQYPNTYFRAIRPCPERKKALVTYQKLWSG